MERGEGALTVAAGCLVTVVAAGTGLGVWLNGAGPGLSGAFEGQRDWSLLYVELPCMLAGFPVITLLVWRLAHAVLGDRGGRGKRRAVAGAAVVLTLTLLAWACRVWLEHRGS